MKVLLSIRPNFVDSIIKGQKKYEYRKIIFKKDVQTVVIYKTTPFCKIIGEFEIEDILSDTPDKIWQITQEFSGINKQFYDEYFYNRKIAYAIKIGKIKQYELEPKKIMQQFKAPQSFMYWEK